jgi:uncharacterized phiE125 gp8 family phage protein
VNYGLQNLTEPTGMVVKLDEAKTHLRVEHGVEDGLILALLSTAVELTEAYSEQRWLTRSVELSLPEFPEGVIEIPIRPVTAVSAIAYTDTLGSSQSITGYQTWLSHNPPLVLCSPTTTWPQTQDGKLAAVRITLAAGYATAEAVPAAAKHAIKLCVEYWYENRGDGKDPNSDPRSLGLPPAVTRLLDLLNSNKYR